ncbi:multisubunit potassium/proton antiporter, PhaA subunit /multisubunit potassium/proton antiporter, PhaB subunit [Paracoccus tibetensis]|uniref:Multisubunit potassium/proton antiporter, PhaA subunit /multisubunit potassium/proton antiporter, PhaB subunit n=2 Tax=Paracoccus tibetensis TaxID=336292 RepID=A0A1G5K4F1_9RHOB|nr:multisubunit potassium/proton antiporter, PhaA subunit /multisubunit potassium/proton antiporter, PhaB subunit [Paracoccus tibetensis]
MEPMAGVALQNQLLLLAMLPFAAALLVAALPQRMSALVAGLSMALALVLLAALAPAVIDGAVLRVELDWVPSAGLGLPLRLDGFSWLFATLVSGIGLLVVTYARGYMAGKDGLARFFALLLGFTGAMQGILLSGNILMLVVFWELTSLFSFLLIGFWHKGAAARDGARTALLVTATGGLCLLLGMLVIGQIAGSYDLDEVLTSGARITGHPLYSLALTLVLIGAFTKSAQFPFHFWLPGAMSAPTPVSAFLHSATMVKAGVFLLIRFSPALGGTEAWFLAVTGIGMATMLIGGLIAIFRNDLKGLLAYSTISQLGLITALAGIGSPGAILAAIFHIVNHAMFKAALFMTAGTVDHQTGTRDIRRLGGLRRTMPLTATLAIIASAAMAGVPLLNGFLSKEMFLAESAAWHNGTALDAALPYLAVVGSVFSVAYSIRLVMAVFFGAPAGPLLKMPSEPGLAMTLPVALLAAGCLAVGLVPMLIVGTLVNDAALSVVGLGFMPEKIAIWHGFNEALMLSIIAFVVGIALWLSLRAQLPSGPEGPPLLHHLRAQTVFDRGMLKLGWVYPRRMMSWIATERLQPQLRLLVVAAVLAAGAAAWGAFAFAEVRRGNDFSGGFALMWLVGAGCAIGAAAQAKYHRFAALVMLGGAGLVTCLTFAWLSAPDLAVTQLLVEVVTTVLLLLGLRWLPQRREAIKGDNSAQARRRRAQDLVIATVGGAGVATVAYAMMTRPLVRNVGDWFLANAYYEGGGTNVVNVILVDFRAFDTFGEIAVLAVVALTIYALLRRFRPAPESIKQPDQQRQTNGRMLDDYLLVPSVIMIWMFPVLMMIAAYFFFRGHDLPGGGFAAGVTMAIAFLLQYLATNVRWVEARLTVLPIRWIGMGLLIAVGTGMGSWVFGYPFLTAYAQYVTLPLIGDVPAATALVFDLGVFALVMGATVLMLIAIAHQSLRAARLREHDENEESR